MKKTTLLLTTSLLAVTAMAGVPKEFPRSLEPKAKTNVNFSPVVNLDKAAISTTNKFATRSSGDVIVDPGCEPQSYNTSYSGYTLYGGTIYLDASTALNNVAFGDNNEVFIQDIVTTYAAGTYVKGTISDNTIRVDFPQTVFYADEDGETYEVEANLLKFTYTETEGGFNIDTEVVEDNFVIYNIDPETGEIKLDLPEWNVPESISVDNLLEYGIGLTTKYLDENGQIVDGWLGYADANQTKVPFTKKVTYVPEGVTTEKWAFIGANNYAFMDVAIDNDTFYLVGLSEFDPAAAVVGKINGSTVTFEAPQYLGYCEDYGVSVYFATCDVDEDGYFVNDSLNNAFVFDYDAANKVLTAVNPNQLFVENAAEDYIYYFRYFMNPVIKYQTKEETYGCPNDPSLIAYYEYDFDYGYGSIVWDIPAVNANGALLYTDQMYYNLYMDGDIYPLSPEDYSYVEEYMEDIPYNYQDNYGSGYDIAVGGSTHWIYFYLYGAESYGVQAFYVADNGITYSTNLITYYPEENIEVNEGGAGEVTTGIQAIQNGNKVAEYYTNIMGQRVSNPEKGIFIKSVVMDNGAVKSYKVIKR